MENTNLKEVRLFNPAVVGLIISNEVKLGKKSILTPQDLLYYVYLLNYQLRQSGVKTSLVRCPINNTLVEGDNIEFLKKSWPIINYIRRTSFMGKKYYDAVDRLDNYKGNNVKVDDKSLAQALEVYNGIVKNEAEMMVYLDKDYKNVDDVSNQVKVAREVYKSWWNDKSLQESKIACKIIHNKTLDKIANAIHLQDNSISVSVAKEALKNSLDMFDKSKISEINFGFYNGYNNHELDSKLLADEQVVNGYLIGKGQTSEESLSK
ncbi:MAG: hypothetical protein J5689_00800 [Clostridia bacterium]|nr:hypothetical protein [Clostridia bacterium]